LFVKGEKEKQCICNTNNKRLKNVYSLEVNNNYYYCID